MNAERLTELIDQFASRRIAVVGDYFLDKYLDIDPALTETSVETGRPAHQVVGIRPSAGVAGTIVNNLADLGCRTIHAIGMTGCDGEGFDLRRCLEQAGCTTTGLIASDQLHTPTYLKPRDQTDPSLTGEHSRYDTKNRRPTPSAVIDRVLAMLDAILPDVDGVIISDQVEEPECGVITRVVRDALIAQAAAQPGTIFWADSRRRIRSYRNVIIKPNQFEAIGHEHPGPDECINLDRLRDLLPALSQANQAPVFVTVGVHGMLVSEPETVLVPGVRLDGPTDPTGAGDSATAGAVLALTSGATCPEAALVGNLVASITVQQLATTGTARPDQLTERLQRWRSQNPDTII